MKDNQMGIVQNLFWTQEDILFEILSLLLSVHQGLVCCCTANVTIIKYVHESEMQPSNAMRGIH